MRKQLIACLAAMSMLVTLTACSGGDTQGAMPDNAATEMVLGTDYRFAADSVYYGINEKESTSFGVQSGKFSYINQDTKDVIQGTVTENGDLEAEGRSISYAVKDGKMSITIGDAEFTYTTATEDKYTAYTQLLKQSIGMTEYDGDGGSEIPEIPTDSVVSEPDSVPDETVVTTEPPTNIPESDLTPKQLNDMAAESVAMIDAKQEICSFSVEYFPETDSYAILLEDIGGLNMTDAMYEVFPNDGLNIATDEGYMYRMDLTGMIEKSNKVTIWWSYPSGGVYGKVKIRDLNTGAEVALDNMIIMDQN